MIRRKYYVVMSLLPEKFNFKTFFKLLLFTEYKKPNFKRKTNMCVKTLF